MDLLFQTPEGRVFSIEVWFFATVLEMKEAIQKLHGFPVSRQRFVFENQVMENEKNTEHYGLLQGSKVHLFLDLPSDFRTPTVKKEVLEPVQIQEMKLPPRHRVISAKRLRVMVLLKSGTRKLPVDVNASENVGELKKELMRMQERRLLSLPANFFFSHKQNLMDEERSFRLHNVRNGDTIEVFNGRITI